MKLSAVLLFAVGLQAYAAQPQENLLQREAIGFCRAIGLGYPAPKLKAPKRKAEPVAVILAPVSNLQKCGEERMACLEASQKLYKEDLAKAGGKDRGFYLAKDRDEGNEICENIYQRCIAQAK